MRSDDNSFIIDNIGQPKSSLERTSPAMPYLRHSVFDFCGVGQPGQMSGTTGEGGDSAEAAHSTGNTHTPAYRHSQFVVPDYEIGVVVVNLSKMGCFASLSVCCPPVNVSSSSHQSCHCFLGTFWLGLGFFTRHSSANRGRLIAGKGRTVGDE